MLPLVWAQEANNADNIYVIKKINFNVTGRSKPFALMYHGEFIEGEQIKGKANLEKYLAEKKQLIMNQLVIEEVNIECTYGARDFDEAIPVYLVVHVKDSRNFIILPYPQFDSNNGFSITLKARDYNFLGTMSGLRIDLGYRQDNDDRIFNFMIDSDIPFRALNLDWNFNFDHSLSYNLGEPLYYQNVTGLSVELPWKRTKFILGIDHYLTFNETISDADKDFYEIEEEYYRPYAAVQLYGAWKINTGIEVGKFGALHYTPRVSSTINYPYSKMEEPWKPVTTLSHSLSFGRTNWVINFRKGFSASLGNSFSFYLDRSDAPLLVKMYAETTYYRPFSRYFGFSSRLSYDQWWQWSERNNKWIPSYSAGSKLRGVLDKDLHADLMLALNVDLPIRVLRFWPSEWFNTKKLEFFNIELFFSPFMDLALLKGPYNNLKKNAYEGTKFSYEDMVKAFGLEVIVYSGFFRSLRLRGSLGYNLNSAKDQCCLVHNLSGRNRRFGIIPQWNEIYIGLDLFY